MVVFAAAAAAVLSVGFAAPASAQEVTGVEVDAPIVMMGPDGTLAPVPGAVYGPVRQTRSFTSCDRYEDLLFNSDRHGCFQINGSGLWANSQSVWFDRSTFTNGGAYTYVNARFNVDRPNGVYYWGTNGGSVNIMNGYGVTIPINNFIEAGNWCMRYQLQRTSGVWENWRETCGPVWA